MEFSKAIGKQHLTVESMVRGILEDLKLTDSKLVKQQATISIEVDIDETVAQRGCVAAMEQTLRFTLLNAIERCGENGEIEVNAYDDGGGLVIEVADSGNDEGASGAFLRSELSRESQFSKSGFVDVSCVRCPQGGVAWMIRQRMVLKMRRIA